ncbi:MAG: CRISPR system precrRNA processing endoribonuclease RAMP protein Cas6 [Promethearchaeota archaeon]
MIKIRFELYPENDVSHGKNIEGYMFRAVLMNWLAEIKPKIVEKLHKTNEKRLYSINFIYHSKIPKIDFIIVSLDPELDSLLFQDIILKDNTNVFIGNNKYVISKIQFERINFRKIFEDAKPVNSFSIKFITPISFNTTLGDYPVRFPIPALFFGNLLNIWNATFKDIEEISKNTFIEWVNAHVYVSYYKMRTEKVSIGKEKPIVGGKGNASYSVIKPNMYYYKKFMEEKNMENFSNEFIYIDYLNNCKWLDILCKLGEYTNAGVNRTAGMGVFRYYPKKYEFL